MACYLDHTQRGGFWRKINDGYIENKTNKAGQFLRWGGGCAGRGAEARSFAGKEMSSGAEMLGREQHLPRHDANTEHDVLNIAQQLTVSWECGSVCGRVCVCARETDPVCPGASL